MNRRRFLRGATGLTAGAVAAGVGVQRFLLPPAPSSKLAPAGELAGELFDSLLPETRALACKAFDDPQRQVTNRGVWLGGARIFGSGFDRRQRGLLTDLLHAGLSPTGRERLPRQQFLRWPGVQLLELLVFGDPGSGPFQVVLSGPHLNLRVGERTPEGLAFGGPQVYGDQRGNGRAGLPGNVWRYQLEAAERLFASMTEGQREAARLPSAPPQTQIQFQGAKGRFDGVPVGELSSPSRDLARALVDDILSTWAGHADPDTLECLERNGGVDALRFATYERDAEGPSPGCQIFRLEGPSAVLHFRGSPHVHAFAHLGLDGDRPLSLGEALGENPTALEGEAVARFFESVLLAETGADVAHYPLDTVAGRLRAGVIRTGDLWNLESWGNAVSVVELDAAHLNAEFRERLVARGFEPGPTVRVATTSYVAEHECAMRLGTALEREPGRSLRQAAADYAREHGFGT